jgi:hypothetical protein
MVYAAAMVLDITPEEVLRGLGHDGTRGAHMQELQRIALMHDKIFALIEFLPVLNGELVDVWGTTSVWDGKVGIILGLNDGRPHAVAWDGDRILDPHPNPGLFQSQQFWWLIDV